MKNGTSPPEKLSALTPMLVVRNAGKAIEWYKSVLQAQELNRLTEPNGNIAHAELRINGCVLMIAEEHPDHNRSPEDLGGTSVILHLYVDEVDKMVELALEDGASLIFPVNDQFYGDRAGRIRDPFGHMWIIAKNIKDVKPEEMQKQMDAMENKE
jgi:PhnB protein